MSTPEIPGYDVANVEAWIADNVDGLQGPFEWTQLEGGHSNLTYALRDADGKRAVVRRPPMGDLLPKAHDMEREFTVISALGPTPVPVPIAYGYCPSPEVTGAHFYVMSMEPGVALYDTDIVGAHLTDEGRANLGLSFIETLAKLHDVDPIAVGLGELGRHHGYVERQLKTWYRSWVASIEAAGYDDARVHELYNELTAAAPETAEVRVVHGDFGLHNCLVLPDGSVSAVLDWEIATIGDPMADFAYSVNAWAQPGDEGLILPSAATLAPDVVDRDTVVARYAEVSGRDISNLNYYRAYNYLKTACIVHGVFARYRQGQKSIEGVDLEGLEQRFKAAIDMSESFASTVR